MMQGVMYIHVIDINPRLVRLMLRLKTSPLTDAARGIADTKVIWSHQAMSQVPRGRRVK
ncbi:hypothetical protein CY34DRAFT_804159 [Suillus luteus UH-Slu-Lm8-n1]|uniref:Uncharacterized protein n=1 Tax=Suillus luteus UH-Slu-Lm8-n1 TaxID=930992 RepID=A0A0D0BIV5_9AGAM|nr:hypothetical protein CY34DRAFT_804159 [Suillus luteus UH-Slu-Lm8-n1]